MRRSETRLRGIGEQLLEIPIAELRDLAELPDEVEIVNVIPKAVANPIAPNPFIPDPENPIHDGNTYVHIRSRYAVRRPARSPLMISSFDSFMEQWHDCWRQKR